MSFFKKVLTPLLLFCFTLFIFILFAGRLKFSFPVTPFNYFSYLAEAFLHHSLSFVSNPITDTDLSIYQNKFYMYWGPAPVLLIIPFILLFGINFSDTLYTAIIASLSISIIYSLLGLWRKLNLISITIVQKITLILFFTFGTVYFYMSVNGSVWFTSQVFSILYIIISLYFSFKYLRSGLIINLIFSSIFFSLAILSRSTLIFYFPFLVAITFLKLYQERPIHSKIFYVKFLKAFSIFIIILLIFIGLSGLYNYLRFNSFSESGYTMANYNRAKFEFDKENYGFMNLHYIPRNFFYMFLNIPSLKPTFPYFNFSSDGNSILFTSPLFGLLFLLVNKSYWSNFKLKLLNASAIFSILLITITLLLFWGTGWNQFGYRYFLDTYPLLFFLLAQLTKQIPLIIIISLTIYSVFINTLGTMWFLGILF